VQDFDEKVKLCVDLLCSNSILVLATQGEDGPYTSLMAYSCTSDGREIYMLSSKKAKNGSIYKIIRRSVCWWMTVMASLSKIVVVLKL